MKKLILKISAYKLVFISVAFLVVFSFGCVKKDEKEIKIGAILPLTGPASQFGQYAKEGIDIGIEELTKQNLQHNFRIIYEDSQGEPKNAVSILNKFIQVDKINILFVLTSTETLAILPTINKENIITFTGTLLPGITEKSQYLFRNATSLEQETNFMANFLSTKMGKPSVAIIYVNNDAGLTAKNLFKEKYISLINTIMTEESYEPNSSDFRTQLSKIKNTNPDYLYILSYKEFGLIMKQARELGIKANFIGTTTFEDPSGVKIAGETANGAIYTFSSVSQDSADSKSIEFQERYIKKYGRKADLYAALFRDNVHILALAFKTNPITPGEIREAILKLNTFEGASGKTKFLPNGDVEKSLIMKIIKDGKFEHLQSKS